ncbi:homeobox-leucine zipper protein ATHB-13-like isoform X1 [Zingiber officinale]|uniref:Homeobox-leucine zipper protein n=1 Tax=Zingiber officinale TaxID=94328 RepID=A0A8J5FXF9_ZINOF|nr:homeobox-leucine zipper protein ATHB-13-like isoform X1 [Zingiber officinale]KAG6496710.1 hypothetical protein ZIOFF_044580 [Zingiber officinale]
MTFNGMLPFFPANLLLHQNSNEEEHRQLQSHMDAGGLAEMDRGKRALMSFSSSEAPALSLEENSLSDNGLAAAGERKKRLSSEQIRVLEKNFEMGRKLDTERKVELARTLGLQPRQVAIWFQNRRARWKTKQMEEEYDELQRQFEVVKEENGRLQAENKRLLSELLALRGRETSTCEPINLNKEAQASCSIRMDADLDISRTSQLLFGSSSGREISKEENSCIRQGNFCSMLDDQSAFWVWSEHNKFHQH